ncbi:uncharacterized protein LOC141817828 [Curcuma longa]|uniref:uncharacterized protein LOC141817828 n=1 Tax=Curcuma longa TaxID=136217 RepID=UPI003D9E93A3
MNHCGMQQNGFAAGEEIRAPFAVPERRPPVFCPKPRRLSQFATAVADPLRPLRCRSSYQKNFSDSKAGADLIDIFLTKGEDQNQLASSPPFFCGSPPSRAANPVVHDARFGEERPQPASIAPSLLTQPNPPMPPKQVRVHAKFGLAPAAVRVEGFDCLDRGRRGCSSITATA